MVDKGEIEQWLTPAIRAALPLALIEAKAWLAPALNGDFRTTIVPALALVAPSGWSDGQSVAWQAAAKEDLRGIPADLLAIGAAAARKVADHPAKIIVAIHTEIGPAWAARKAELARVQLIDDVASGRRKRKPWEPEPFDHSTKASPAEVAAIIAEAGIAIDRRGRQPVAGPRRKPTEADYLELGVSPDKLATSRGIAAEERSDQSRAA